MQNKFRIIDCFCGAGGLSLGFEQAGFDVVYAFDLDATAIETYKNNAHLHHGQAFVRDINNVSKKSIEEDLGHGLGHITLSSEALLVRALVFSDEAMIMIPVITSFWNMLDCSKISGLVSLLWKMLVVFSQKEVRRI